MLPVWVEKTLSRLDESQREAATADPNTSTLVQAGAGSGKTQTMACRIAFLIACGVSPLSILGICFTRKAAEELRSRVAWALQGSPYAMDARRLKLRTLHAFGLENLRRYNKIDDSTDVYDQRRQAALAKEVVAAHACVSRDSDAADRLVEYVNTVKTKKALPPRETNPQQQEAYLFTFYQEMLHRDRNGVDFGDLQLMFYELLKPLKAPQAQAGTGGSASAKNGEEKEEERPPRSLPSPACDSLRHRYTHIIVDEFQDLNEVQFEIIALLAGDACRVTCVGDPNQCIYGWRGALPQIFHQWKRRFPKAEERVLRINYRSDPPIVSAANGIVRATQQPFHSRRNLRTVLVGCVDAEEEYEVLPFMIQHFVRVRESQLRYGDIAVLCRTRARVAQCIDTLRDHGIPVVELKSTAADGVSSMASLLAYFRLCVNPHRDDDVHEVLLHAPHALSPRLSRAFFMSLYASRDDLRRRDAWGESIAQRSATTAATANGEGETRSHACEPLGARYSLYNVLRQLVHHGFASDAFPLMCKVTKPTAAVLREFITVVEAARQLFDEFNYRFEGRPVGPTPDDVADVVAACMDVVLTKAHFESADAAVEFTVVSHKKGQAGAGKRAEGARKRSRDTHDGVAETSRASGAGRRGEKSSSATLADAVAQSFSHAEATRGRSGENKQDMAHSTAFVDAAAPAVQDGAREAESEPVSKRLTLRDLLFSAIANVRQEAALAQNNSNNNSGLQQPDLFPAGAAVVKMEDVVTTAVLDSATPSVIDVDAEGDDDTNGSGSLLVCSAKVEAVRPPPPSRPLVSQLQPLQRPEQLLLYVLDEFATLLPSDDFGPLKLQVAHCENNEASDEQDIRTTAAVSVGTVHSAKGLEWPAVLLPSCYDGHYPLSNDPEERRVFYVAMSRAQTQLVMITAQRHVVPADPKSPKGLTKVESLMTTPFVVEIAKQRGTVQGTFADVKPHSKKSELASGEATAQEGPDVDGCGSIQLFDYSELKRGYHEQQLQVGVVPAKQREGEGGES